MAPERQPLGKSDRFLWTPMLLLGVAVAYFGLAKLGLLLAQVHPNATAIWPPAGFALATFLLFGKRVWPAIFLGAFVANVTTAGSIWTSTAIAAGNTLEAVTAWWLVTRYSAGRDAFQSPRGVVRFAVIAIFASTPISATVGVTSLALGGVAGEASYLTVWTTWWVGDIAGILVLCPAFVLWYRTLSERTEFWNRAEAFSAILLGAAIGVAAFAPVIEPLPPRSAIAFLAVVPLLWASLRLGTTITATIGVILASLAVWGTVGGHGPFGGGSLNDALLNLLSFMISVSVPSLALSAELDRRRQRQRVADETIEQRTVALGQASETIRRQTSEREQTQQQLLEQTIHLREAQRQANLGSWSWDVAANRVSWSDQLYKIYGIAPEDLEPTVESYLSLVHADDREKVRASIERVLQSGHVYQTEERIVRPNGEVRYLRTSGEVLRDDSGNPVRMIGICADITSEREAAAKLANAQQELLHSQKLEALGKLTGGVAHDFNNLLMVVSASTEFLRRRISDDELAPKLEAIKTAVQRGTALTRQLLTFSRQQVLNPVPLDLKSHLPRLSELLKSSLRGDITLSLDAAPDLWLVKADSAQLELTILNLATNARDAMPHGGTLTVTARNVELTGLVQNLRGHFVALAFEDTGTGIAPDHIGRIFEPFFSTKEVGAGTGLGLSQAYGFAQVSGGAITVSSQPGCTTFTLYLPRSLELKVHDEPVEVATTTRTAGRALVVEDNSHVARAAAGMLAELGYLVDVVSNADHALDRVRDRMPFDLVLTDVVMPGSIDGIELANVLRKAYPTVPVVIMSGYFESASLSTDEFTVLQKPFDAVALVNAIEEALSDTAGGTAHATS
jgi:PAS domain S-box-containing protein